MCIANMGDVTRLLRVHVKKKIEINEYNHEISEEMA